MALKRTRAFEQELLAVTAKKGAEIRAKREANKSLQDKFDEAVKDLEKSKELVSMQIANLEKFIPAGEDRDNAILAMKNVVKSKEREIESLKKQLQISTRGIGSTSTSGTGK